MATSVVLAALIVLSGLCSVPPAAAATVCLLKLKVDPKQSPFTGTGNVAAPLEGKITGSNHSMQGHVWLRVPTNTCPPSFTAQNADDLLQQSSLEVPIGSQSLSFTTYDNKNLVRPTDPKAPPIANMDFMGIGIGLTGTEPLGPGAVIVGQGTVDEASTAAQKVCAQLVLLNGTLDMSSKLSGPRTAAAKHVAMNRTLGAGISVAKKSNAVSNITLFISNMTLLFNITPESADGMSGTPGVMTTTAKYLLAGDVVATADLNKASNWQSVDADKVAWATVPRQDSPVIVGATKPGKPRYIGVNSSIPQECKPSRVLDASGMLTSINATSTKSAAGGIMAASSMQVVLAAGLALLAAALAL